MLQIHCQFCLMSHKSDRRNSSSPLLCFRHCYLVELIFGLIDTHFRLNTSETTMTQQTYQLPLTFEQILNLVLQLPKKEQEKLIQEIEKTSLKNEDENLLNVLDRIGRNAQAKGLTAEILEELLADES